jgi:hemerythrin-like metal-binding protein
MSLLISTKREKERRQIERYPITNIVELDQQNQSFLNTLNQLIQGVRDQRDHQELEVMSIALGDQLIINFGLEEKYMMMSNYPEKERHFESHRDFLLPYIHNKKSFYTTKSGEMLHVLSHLMASHINTLDRKMANYLLKQHW